MPVLHTLLILSAVFVLGQPSSAVTLRPVFTSLPKFDQPVAMLQAPGDTSRWFVVEKAGVVRVFANEAGVSTARVFADITRKVHTGGELEAGLLGMAFDPGFGRGTGKNRWVYVFYSGAPNSGFRLRLTISRFEATPALDALDAGSETRLIGIDKLETNHNGGHLLFGPDGMLYVGVGDGGGEPDFESGMFAFLTPGATSGTYENRTLIAPFPPSALQVPSFAERSDGELFVLDLRSGRVHALEFPPGPN